MNDQIEKAFEFAADLTKQLITLSTVIVGAVVTFFDKVHLDRQVAGIGLRTALIVYLASIVSGILAVMALTKELGRPGGGATPYVSNVQLFSGLQIVLFLAATLWVVIVTTAS